MNLLLTLPAARRSARFNGRPPGGYPNPNPLALGGWLRRLSLSGPMLLSVLAANAQTNWTAWFQTGEKQLSDVAYGAGTYVAVSTEDGLIRISTDGITWTN